MTADDAPGELGRTVRGLLHPRLSKGRTAVAVLCGVLGFALVAQVHSNRAAAGLSTARPADLLGLLADLQDRATRLNQQIDALQVTREQLLGTSGNSSAAVAAARRQLQSLGILAGTVAAAGPGVVVTISDPRRAVSADILFGLLEELRDGGAEVIQFGPVRVVASTYVVDDPGVGVLVDGQPVAPPYRVLAIGDPRTLAGALAIAGGIDDTIAARSGARITVDQEATVVIRALRSPPGAR